MNLNPWEDSLMGPRTRRAAPVSKATYKPNREIVVKIVSTQKAGHGVRSAAHYIAGHGGNDDLGLFCHDGSPIEKDAINAHLDEWELSADKDNYSKAYREASFEDRAKMPDAYKYYKNQSIHMILSLPYSHSAVSDEQLHGIAQDYLKPFAEEGHRAVYAIHRHQEKPHIHFVLSSEGSKTRLKIKREQLQKLREHAKGVAGEHGIEVEATRCIDRKTILERIEGHEKHREQLERLEYLKGLEDTLKKERDHPNRIPVSNAITRLQVEMGREIKEPPLRPKHDYFTAKVRDNSVPLLKRQAPVWYENHGVGAQAALLDRPVEELGFTEAPPRPVEFPALGQKTNMALQGFLDKRFEEPDKARGAFLEMAAENPRTAFWYANNRAEVFGKTTDDDTAKISQRDVRLSRDWQEEAWKRIWERPYFDELTRKITIETNRSLEDVRAAKARTEQYARDIKYLREHGRLPEPEREEEPERGFARTLLDRAKGMFTSKGAPAPQQEKEQEKKQDTPVPTPPSKERAATPVSPAPKKAQERPTPSPIPEKTPAAVVKPEEKTRKKKPRSRGREPGHERERER